MVRLEAVSLVVILALLAFKPIQAQEGSTPDPPPELVNITLILNGQPVVLTIPSSHVDLFIQNAQTILENGPLQTIDIDECSSQVTNNCNLTAEICVNVNGSFNCPCKTGFLRAIAGGNCVRDLCHEQNITCESSRQCDNNATDLQCICAVGFHPNGTDCGLITPCLPNSCQVTPNSYCNATDATNYTCDCVTGYVKDGDDCVAQAIQAQEGSTPDPPPELVNITLIVNGQPVVLTIPSSHIDLFIQNAQTIIENAPVQTIDIDECSSQVTNNCNLTAEICVNVNGSFNCPCKTGFLREIAGGNCAQAIQAQEGSTPDPPTELVDITLIVNGQSVVFTIPSSYVDLFIQNAQTIIEISPVQTIDIDECSSQVTNNCNLTAEICVNVNGSFNCPCKTGFLREIAGGNCVRDLCHEQNITCESSRQCDNNATDLQCICAVGFHPNENGTDCGLITPCFPNRCQAVTNSHCNATDATNYTCDCVTGYVKDGDDCVDVDECENHDCPSISAKCTNTEGSFACACNTGYSGNGTTCEDLNECAKGTHNCSPNAGCTNTAGSFDCTCNTGYSGGGETCIDINECDEVMPTHNCDNFQFAHCRNEPGTFSCFCNTGFTGNVSNCADIEECANNLDNCDDESKATCTNVLGSFNCICDEGYEGDGRTCTDIDECEDLTDNCDDEPRATCSNTIGSFECACNEGYTGDGYNCTDIDECADPNDNNCAPEVSTCENTPGSYECSCGPGYSGDGRTCSPKEGSMRIKISVRSSSRKRRNAADDAFATALKELLRVLLMDNTLNVTVLDSEVVGDLTTYTLQIDTLPENIKFLERTLSQLKETSLSNVEIANILYPVTESYTGSVPSTNTSEETCTAIEDFIRGNLTATGAITDDTTVTCNGSKRDGVVEFTVIVDGAFAGTVSIPDILENYDFEVTPSILCVSDSCAPNGICDDSKASVVCSCPSDKHDLGITDPGKNCGSPILDPECGASTITIKVHASFFVLRGVEPDTLHLLDPTCKDEDDDDLLLTLTSGLDKCGWQLNHVGNTLVYTNNVTNIVNGVHTHPTSISFPVTCTYPAKFSTGDTEEEPPQINVIESTILVQNAGGDGQLAVTMTVYTDKDFTVPLVADTSVQLPSPLYVKATHTAAATDTNFLKLQTCWITPTNNATDEKVYSLIANGCAADVVAGAVVILSNGDNQTASFKMEARRFEGHNAFFVHCDVEVCQNDCAEDCTSSSSRRRRRASTDANEITVGPIDLTENTDTSPPVANNTGAIVAGVVAGVLLVVCGVMVAQRLRKRQALKNESMQMQGRGFISPREADYRTPTYENDPVTSRRSDY